MSSDSSKSLQRPPDEARLGLLKFAAVVQTAAIGLLMYLVPPTIAATLLVIGVEISGKNISWANHWLQTAPFAQFLYILITEALVLGAVIVLLRWFKESWATIGVRRPKVQHLLYTFGGLAAYFAVYIVVAGIIGMLIHLNYDQQQEIGFNTDISATGKMLAFISLVILPPLAEETVFRGFLYTRLRRTLPKIWAGVAVSVLFAAAHLQFGSGNALLWTAALDTFVLSCVLVYVREKTGTIWAGVGIHALKNFVAFSVLFGIFSGLM
jgi:membrane protease YdiL (CAAX protease family)